MDYITAVKILGLKPGADPAEVKRAYRSLSKELHPDNLRDSDRSSYERFLLVTEAYEFLEHLTVSDPSAGVNNAVAGKAGSNARVFGTPVSYHVTSAEERSRRQQREKEYRSEMQKRRAKQREEALARAEELKREKLQKQKEKALLNEIRMIRLAHIIEATLATDQKKGQSN